MVVPMAMWGSGSQAANWYGQWSNWNGASFLFLTAFSDSDECPNHQPILLPSSLSLKWRLFCSVRNCGMLIHTEGACHGQGLNPGCDLEPSALVHEPSRYMVVCWASPRKHRYAIHLFVYIPPIWNWVAAGSENSESFMARMPRDLRISGWLITMRAQNVIKSICQNPLVSSKSFDNDNDERIPE